MAISPAKLTGAHVGSPSSETPESGREPDREGDLRRSANFTDHGVPLCSAGEDRPRRSPAGAWTSSASAGAGVARCVRVAGHRGYPGRHQQRQGQARAQRKSSKCHPQHPSRFRARRSAADPLDGRVSDFARTGVTLVSGGRLRPSCGGRARASLGAVSGAAQGQCRLLTHGGLQGRSATHADPTSSHWKSVCRLGLRDKGCAIGG